MKTDTLKIRIPILVSLNENYLPQLRVMMLSLHLNNPEIVCQVYLLHRGIPAEALSKLQKDLEQVGDTLCAIPVDESLFEKAPISDRYPQEMYYRLLAPHLLPEQVKRILYLDPDTLIINPIRPLWETDLQGNLFAAAAHTGKTELANNVNQLRLGTAHDYYNSGVLLMDLEQGRKEIIPEQIFRYVEQHSKELILPDQDILNALYGKRILPLEDVIWNYDARNYSNYKLRSNGAYDVPWVMQHTAILHFCGKEKPWNPRYIHRFGILYQHYMQLAQQTWGSSLQARQSGQSV